MNVCEEYDNAAVVRLVDGKPEWDTTPDRIHVTANLAEEAVEFLSTAYRLTPGCRPDVVHGDLVDGDDA